MSRQTSNHKHRHHKHHQHKSHGHQSKEQQNQEQKKRKHKNMIRAITSTVLSFFLSLIIFGLLFLLGTRIGVGSRSTMLAALDSSDYYNSVHQAIEQNVITFLKPTGLPASVIEGVFSKEAVRMDARQIIINECNQKEYTVVFDSINETFQSNVEQYATKHGLIMTKEDGIKQLTDRIQSIYLHTIQFPFTKYLVRFQNIVADILYPLMIIAMLTGIGIFILLIKIQKWQHRGLRYCAYGVMGGTLMTIALPAIILVTKFYQRVQISPEYLKEFVTEFLQWGFLSYIYISLLGVLTFIVLLIVIQKKKLTI